MNNRDRYRLRDAAGAKTVATEYLRTLELDQATDYGLPEIDDRFDIWRVPVLSKAGEKIGEVVVDAISTLVDEAKSTRQEVLENRLLGRSEKSKRPICPAELPRLSRMANTIRFGDCEQLLKDMPAGGVNLVFTSPPRYECRWESEQYRSYEGYLLQMRRILHECYRVLSEGRFFVLHVLPVRYALGKAEQRQPNIPVVFDWHRLFCEEGFEFVDDIKWYKPDMVAQARKPARVRPLTYKPLNVTEHLLVYRKQTDKPVSFFVKNHPDKKAVASSRIDDDAELTDVWQIASAQNKRFPDQLPVELCEKVIRYYSIKGDVVLDPFAGTGSAAKAAVALQRRFALMEKEPKYMELLVRDFKNAKELHIDWVNVEIDETTNDLFNGFL